MSYTLGDIDWKRFDRDFDISGLAEIDEIPFENDDPTLTFAQWFDHTTNDDVSINELIDVFDLDDTYNIAIFDPPADINEEAQKICKSIHWHGAQNDVNRLKDLGVEPIAQTSVSLVSLFNLTFKRYIVFDGESETISFTIVGNMPLRQDKPPAVIFGGEEYSLRPVSDDAPRGNDIAERFNGKFAVILENIEDGVKFRETETSFNVEKYVKESR